MTIAVLNIMLCFPQLTRACAKGWITYKGGNGVYFFVCVWRHWWCLGRQNDYKLYKPCDHFLGCDRVFWENHDPPHLSAIIVLCVLMIWVEMPLPRWVKIPCSICMFFLWAFKCWVESLSAVREGEVQAPLSSLGDKTPKRGGGSQWTHCPARPSLWLLPHSIQPPWFLGTLSWKPHLVRCSILC